MQFMVIGRDGDDEGARDRRAAARPAHLAQPTASDGHRLVFAATLLDDLGATNGSLLVVECENRAALDRYLSEEPYVRDRVWQTTEVRACSVPEIFGG